MGFVRSTDTPTLTPTSNPTSFTTCKCTGLGTECQDVMDMGFITDQESCEAYHGGNACSWSCESDWPSCITKGYQLEGTEIYGARTKQDSAEKCSLRCKEHGSSCKFWKWHVAKPGDAWYHDCRLYYSAEKRGKDSNVWGGDASCLQPKIPTPNPSSSPSLAPTEVCPVIHFNCGTKFDDYYTVGSTLVEGNVVWYSGNGKYMISPVNNVPGIVPNVGFRWAIIGDEIDLVSNEFGDIQDTNVYTTYPDLNVKYECKNTIECLQDVPLATAGNTDITTLTPTSNPTFSPTNHEKLACHYVPDHTYALADGSGIEYEYGSLMECFEKCDADPYCLGFLDRSSGGKKICAWKSGEKTLQLQTSCDNDFYRKPYNYEKLACHYVPDHTYALADGSGTEYEYNGLLECFEKCDADPQCLGFLNRFSDGKMTCVWKSDEKTLQTSTCQNDYYRKPVRNTRRSLIGRLVELMSTRAGN